MSWTLCTSGAAIADAGANVNSTIVASGAALADWSDRAESEACDIARSDVVTNFSSLPSSGKEIFQTYCAAWIAQKIIGYEPEAIGNSAATLRLNILENNIGRVRTLIKDDKQKTYLGIT